MMKQCIAAGVCLALAWGAMPGLVQADGAPAKEAPTVAGPAPAFQERARVKLVNDRVYLDIRYPEFGIPLVDQDIRERVDAHQTMEEFDAALPGLAPEAPYWFILGYEVYAVKRDVLSVLLSSSFMDGFMANTNYRVWGASWDVAAQRRIRLGDLFPDWEAAREGLRALFQQYFADPQVLQKCAEALVPTMDQWLCPDNTDILLYPAGYAFEWRLGLIFRLENPAVWECSVINLEREDLAAAGADFRYWPE